MKAGYKMTELGELPEEWELVKLGSFVSKVGSGITPKGGSESYLPIGVPFIRSQNVIVNKLELKNVAFISEEQHYKMAHTKLYPLDVLLNITGASIGRSCVIPNTFKEGNVNQHVCIIRPTPNLNPFFLCEYLNSYLGQNQIERFQAGGNREGLNFKQIRSFFIPMPSLPEQQKIAQILSTVDRKIEAIGAQIEQARVLKKGLMQRLLTKGIGHTRFKETVLGEVPEGWEVVKLKEISNVVRGGSPRPARSPLLFNGDFLNWITVAELTNNPNKYLTKTKTCLTELGAKSTRILLPEIVLLANSGATLGIPKILKIKAGANDGIAAFLNLAKVSTEFLYYFLQSLTKYFREQLAPGSGQPNLNTSLIGNTLICIPPIFEQNKIVDFLSTIDKKIDTLQAKQAAYRELKKGMMQQLLTGKIRVHTKSTSHA